MSMDQLMALVPIEAASALSSTTTSGRKSRWERSVTVSAADKRKSRFGPHDDKPYLPPPFVDLPPGLTPLQVDQFLREQRLEELTQKLQRGELEFGDPDIRPPSPPPAYDKNGNRTNTRDVRVRTAMAQEHQRLLEYMVKSVVGFVPPTDYKPLKKVRRIIIPQEKYPEYNFMGLIIGPRGCNHKRLEAESGAQISIRGRGTQKEGKKTDHQTEEEATMPQHIHVAADTEESIDKAVSLIEPLLNPFHPTHEEFKKKGLEQLALVNGVSLAKLETRCTACGATGHLSWECPDAQFQTFQKAQVKCGLCGDKGHVTMDCKLARGLSNEQIAELEKSAQIQETATESLAESSPDLVSDSTTTIKTTTAGPLASPLGSAGAPVQLSVLPPPPARTYADEMRLDEDYSQMISEITGKPPPPKQTHGHQHHPHPSHRSHHRHHRRDDETPRNRVISHISTPPPGSTPPYVKPIPPPPSTNQDGTPYIPHIVGNIQNQFDMQQPKIPSSVQICNPQMMTSGNNNVPTDTLGLTGETGNLYGGMMMAPSVSTPGTSFDPFTLINPLQTNLANASNSTMPNNIMQYGYYGISSTPQSSSMHLNPYVSSSGTWGSDGTLPPDAGLATYHGAQQLQQQPIGYPGMATEMDPMRMAYAGYGFTTDVSALGPYAAYSQPLSQPQSDMSSQGWCMPNVSHTLS